MNSIKITVHLIGILRGKGGHGPLWPSLPSASDPIERRRVQSRAHPGGSAGHWSSPVRLG